MEAIIEPLLAGILQSFEPLNLFMLVLGCTIGLFVGALPGLGSVNGVAILLPVTFLVPPTTAIIFLCAIYYGAMYGGAVSSITLGIPGASTAVATVFDGRPAGPAGQGRPGLGDRRAGVVYRRHGVGGVVYPVSRRRWPRSRCSSALRKSSR